jgi:cytochrome oxidase Cu insertion factor (SCO1/SenC/PrrC family)
MKLAAAILALAGAALAQDFRVGGTVSNFPLRDLDGQETSFAALKGKVTLVAFISAECPVSNEYNERMNALFREYSGRVNLIFVNSNANESADEVRRHARDSGFRFAVYKDPNNVVADRFGATRTPETYVIDAAGVVRYHGPIDDSQNPARIKKQHLRAALDSLIDGQPVAIPEAAAFGCTIKKVRKEGGAGNE